MSSARNNFAFALRKCTAPNTDPRLGAYVSLPLRKLELTERKLVDVVNDLCERACRCLESSPRHGLGRFPIGVEVMEVLARTDGGREAMQKSRIARGWDWTWIVEQRHAERFECIPHDLRHVRTLLAA